MIGIAVLSILLVVLLLLGVRIAFAMLGVSILGLVFLLPTQQLSAIGSVIWSSVNNPLLTSVTLFILMGEIFAQSGMGNSIYSAMTPLVSRIPGGLLHSNIVACSIFAATSGSSVGTAAAISAVAIPQLNARHYPRYLTYGSLAAGGTLGILIPPSLSMIIYGVLTGTSIGKLFIAGIIPGILLASFFSLCIGVLAWMKPHSMPPRETLGIGASLKALVGVTPLMIVVVLVLGSLYLGVTTPTESAAIGVVGVGGIAALHRRLSPRVIATAVANTVGVSAMIVTILISSAVLNYIVGFLGVAARISDAIMHIGVSPNFVLFVLFIAYLIMGMLLDTISILVLTIPVVFPSMVALGFDPVWFGVWVTVNIELALITPPVGLNLFIIKGVDPTADWKDILIGSLVFSIILTAFIFVISVMPSLATWLPSLVK